MRRVHGVFAGLLAIAACSCGNGTATTDSSPATPPPLSCVETTTLITRDNVFEPTCMTVQVGDGLTIRNEGTTAHNFSIEGFVHDVDTQPGEETNTESLGLDASTYRFLCKYHVQIAMDGIIRVADA